MNESRYLEDCVNHKTPIYEKVVNFQEEKRKIKIRVYDNHVNRVVFSGQENSPAKANLNKIINYASNPRTKT